MSLSQKARLQPWYQPNFGTGDKAYVAFAVAPHGDTARWAYTVPAYRYAMLTFVTYGFMRVTAPTTAGRCYAMIYNSTANQWIVVMEEISATIGVGKFNSAGSQQILSSGTTIQGHTQDGSTGGLYDYAVYAAISEFNT